MRVFLITTWWKVRLTFDACISKHPVPHKGHIRTHRRWKLNTELHVRMSNTGFANPSRHTPSQPSTRTRQKTVHVVLWTSVKATPNTTIDKNTTKDCACCNVNFSPLTELYSYSPGHNTGCTCHIVNFSKTCPGQRPTHIHAHTCSCRSIKVCQFCQIFTPQM